MKQQEFRFDEASPLQEFIDKYRDQIVGHTLNACYIDSFLYVNCDGASSPVFFVLDDGCVGIEYLFPGHATIITADENDFEIAGEVRSSARYKEIIFHSRISDREDSALLWCTEMPAMRQKITDIRIGRHSDQHEDYPNSLRPEGGDYFSWIKLALEDGTQLYINAQSAENDGYVNVWLENLPAYTSIKAELDKSPSDLEGTELEQVVWGCNPKPDELAELAMYYMRKCDHEIEKYQKEKGAFPPHGYNTLYTDHLNHVIQLFKSREMNIDYVDSTGKSLIDLALEIGEAASSRALPGIYWERMLSSSLARIARSMESDYDILMMHKKEERALYDSLPEKVKKTRYGEKLLEVSRNDYDDLKKKINELKTDLNMID